MNTSHLFHITTHAEFDAARATGEYRPAAFAREGFIHCSRASQLAATAERIFHGREDLVLLEIDAALLSSSVIDENLEGGLELYPHIYGALPIAAVVTVHPMPLDSHGHFSLPASVTSG